MINGTQIAALIVVVFIAFVVVLVSNVREEKKKGRDRP